MRAWLSRVISTELPFTGSVFGLSRMGFAGLGTVLLTAFIVLSPKTGPDGTFYFSSDMV